jgi:hypothetical protein
MRELCAHDIHSFEVVWPCRFNLSSNVPCVPEEALVPMESLSFAAVPEVLRVPLGSYGPKGSLPQERSSIWMATSKKSQIVLLKVRIPKELMGRIKKYLHKRELDTRTDAVIELLERALAPSGRRSQSVRHRRQ